MHKRSGQAKGSAERHLVAIGKKKLYQALKSMMILTRASGNLAIDAVPLLAEVVLDTLKAV